MSQSETSICNLALARVGQGRIANINDAGRNAELCNLHYEQKRDALLRMYRWKFAIKRVELPALSTAPVFGYTYAYELPNDCLRVISINELDPELGTDLNPGLWDREENTIVTDLSAPIKVKYIARITDPTKFDDSFIDALASYLAIYLSPSLREMETDVIATLRQEFQAVVTDAKYANAIEARKRNRRNTRTNWA